MSSSPFSIHYQRDIKPGQLEQDETILAAISFSQQDKTHAFTKPLFSLATHDLDDTSLVEIWKSPEPVITQTIAHPSGDLKLSRNSQILFGLIQLDESRFDNLIVATQFAYQQILATLEQSPFNKLLRVWNYFSLINDESSGLERYKQFCLGRQKALDEFGNFPYAPPAATAIGTNGGDLQIYFIAAREPGIQLENPRQTSAFLYPREYGEVSPAFSRATYKSWGSSEKHPHEHLYISGTASIVGHESKHPGNAKQQLLESLENIEALIHHGHDTLGLSIQQLSELSHLKVYLRDRSFLEMAKQELNKRFGGKMPAVLYLQGDVCRADLLVEIEADYVSSASTVLSHTANTIK